MYYGDYNSLYASYVPTYMNPMSYNYSIQQCCCSSKDMLDKIYGQQSVNTINNYQYRNSYDNVVQSQQEEIEDSITNYMDKKFLYESELKKIEEKFDFKFDYISEYKYKNDKDYLIIKRILNKIKNKKNNKENLFLSSFKPNYNSL